MSFISCLLNNCYNNIVQSCVKMYTVQALEGFFYPHRQHNTNHSGWEGCSSQRKLIIDMSYIFEKVKQNAIQIHWNQNRALREFNVTDIYIGLYHEYPQWILRILRGFSHLYSKLKKYPHRVIYFLKGIIEAYLKM